MLHPAWAERLRIATYNPDLVRRGPGLLLKDLVDGTGADIEAALAAIEAAAPDVLLLTGMDQDGGGAALAALDARLGGRFPHRFAPRSNRGMASGLDLDGDGRRGGPGDAQGYGEFAGQSGMALLSRLPIDAAAAVDLSGLLWADLPGADLPRHPDGAPFPSAEAQAAQRLSTSGHWDVPLILPGGGRLHVLAFYASTPAFDGAEDRNGKRAHDELRLWSHYLDGRLGHAPPKDFVLTGDSNLDPHGGEGDRAAMAAMLADPRLQDPRPTARGEVATAFWPDIGALRVDYVLPAAQLEVTGAGVLNPPPDTPLGALLSGDEVTRHRLVWVDLRLE